MTPPKQHGEIKPKGMQESEQNCKKDFVLVAEDEEDIRRAR
jgi:hypothetical protein